MMHKLLSNSLALSLFITLEANELVKDSFDDLESLINDVSDLATNHSLNVDYLPSVVSVIDAQTYLDSGIKTLAEALDMLPGFQIQLSPMGYTMTTIRGFKNPNAYLSDKLKIYIDGVAIHNEVSGSSNFYMDFPMQLVEKIEVLRGPGSTTHGAGAFYSTINVITKLGNNKNENSISLQGGSYKYASFAANFHTTSGNWELLSDGYFEQNEKAIFIKELQSESNKAYTDEHMKNFSVAFNAQNGGFEFLTRIKNSRYGNFYSFEGEIDPKQDKDHSNRYIFSQLSYKTALYDFQLETKAGVSHREFQASSNMYYGITNKFELVDIHNIDDAFLYSEDIHEENFNAELLLSVPKTLSNSITVAAGARAVRITHDKFHNSVEEAIANNKSAIVQHINYNDFRYREENEPAYWANPTTTLLPKNTKRDIGFAYLQDLISIGDNIDLNIGLRADHYSDFGLQLSKRAGLVYRAHDKLIFKLLYGSAFRTPSFIEAYQNGHINSRAGDSNIKAEETNTFEAVVIYLPNFNHKISLSSFYSQLNNVIDLEELSYTPSGYQNYDYRVSKGVEFEYYYHPRNHHNLYLNASYIESDYTLPVDDDSATIEQSMPDISKVMIKGVYLYSFNKKLSFGTTWKYFSETTSTKLEWIINNESKDPTVDAYHVIDETISYKFSPSSEAKVSIKNLFDSDVRVPSYYYGVAGGLKREGRNYLLSYIQKF